MALPPFGKPSPTSPSFKLDIASPLTKASAPLCRLVATVGKENQKRLTKRAIQEVNVPKACEKILDPGAPLALRLQGSLLYGVSRVFSQQCGYVLTEAEKTQSDMMTFFRIMKTSETDPQAGKTKRQNIVLEDDPAFDLLSALPNLDQLKWDKDLMLPQSQGSSLLFSQLTPLGSVRRASLSGCNAALINLELPSSSHSAASCRIPSDFGHQSPLFDRISGQHLHDMDMAPFQPFLDDVFDPVSGLGLEFDGDGNLIEAAHPEPELPILPGFDENMARPSGLAKPVLASTGEVDPEAFLLGEDAYMLELGEPALPDAAAFPTAQTTEAPGAEQAQQAVAKLSRTRRSRPHSMLDSEIVISRRQFRNWTDNYAEIMTSSRKRPAMTTASQARKNAIAFLYGNGVANIGSFRGATGSLHPLAIDFAGSPLQCRLKGKEPDPNATEVPVKKRGRPRKYHEAFEVEEDVNQDRSPNRQRVDEEAELGRGDINMTDGFIRLDDDFIPEIGMDAVPALEDRHSSSVMPWSRPGSVVPGSSVRGSAQKQRTAPSPLFGRGSGIGAIERFSDPAEPPFDFGNFGSEGSSLIFDQPVGPVDVHAANDNLGTGPLDAASQEFLNFAKEGAAKKGKALQADKFNRRWVEFEDLIQPKVHSRDVAAQAFLHLLTLATKNTILVHQEKVDMMRPFGPIKIGLDVSGIEEQAESEDELA